MKPEIYDNIWSGLIEPTYQSFETRDGGLVLPQQAKDEIKVFYDELISYAKKHYMAAETERLNRHKVAAAMMIAILKAKPIKKADPLFFKENKETGRLTPWPINERLAVTVGFSVLHGFIMERLSKAASEYDKETIKQEHLETVCKQDAIIFADGIPIDEEDQKNLVWELYQVRLDGAYNLLTLAHILKDVERLARYDYFLNHKNEEPGFFVLKSDNSKIEEF